MIYFISMNPFEQPKQEIAPQNSLTKRAGLESVELIPMKVNDLRNQNFLSFDLNKFVTVIGRLKTEGFFKIRTEFQDSDYGKYMSTYASAESDSWDEAVQKARAIEITATTQPSRGFEHREGRTEVEVKILMSGNDGRIFTFYFHNDGKYSNGAWKDVQLQKRLVNETGEDNFTLDVDKVPKLP